MSDFLDSNLFDLERAYEYAGRGGPEEAAYFEHLLGRVSAASRPETARTMRHGVEIPVTLSGLY